MPSPDRLTLETQFKQLTANHQDLLGSLQGRQQQVETLEKQLAQVRTEIEQYKGALSYSQHVQEQVKKVLEQAVAAEMAAKLAAEGAAKAESQAAVV